MSCPGSVRLSRGIPNLESEHSRAGTAAHAVAEKAIARCVDPGMWDGLEVEGVEVDDEMIEAVRVYTDYCRGLIERCGEYHWIEKKFSLGALNPPGVMFGTSDFDAYDPETYELEVVDYKHGKGVVVQVKGNKQLRYYGLGAVLEIQKEYPDLIIKTVKLTIVQPRASHPDGVIRSEVIDYYDLLAFAGELLDAARETLKPDAPLHAGSHCRFCPASATCPEQRNLVQLTAQVAFEAMPLDVPPAPESIPPDVFADILHKLPILEDWAKAMRAHALRELEAGNAIAGFKLVAKRATRKWKSEAQVEKWLWDEKGMRPEEIYTQKLKSPAQIEKLVGKKELPEEFVVKESSGNTLAPNHDGRPAVALAAGDVFEALNP